MMSVNLVGSGAVDELCFKAEGDCPMSDCAHKQYEIDYDDTPEELAEEEMMFA